VVSEAAYTLCVSGRMDGRLLLVFLGVIRQYPYKKSVHDILFNWTLKRYGGSELLGYERLSGRQDDIIERLHRTKH
jgi:hypothetical protein